MCQNRLFDDMMDELLITKRFQIISALFIMGRERDHQVMISSHVLSLIIKIPTWYNDWLIDIILL